MASSPQKRASSYTPLFVQRKPRNPQLPALNIPSSSLTEGTTIPPPTDSPTDAEASETFEAEPISGHRDAGSTPQTPLASLDSPAPLRSHPTSTHSLSRQFQLEGVESPNRNTHNSNGYSSGNGSLRATPTAYGSVYGAAHVPSPRSNGHNNATEASSTTESSYKNGPSSDGSPAPSNRYPPKRQPTSESIDPPSKRPLSVRKFLGIRALSAAFGRSSTVKDHEKQAGNGDASSGPYHKRNRSTDMLSLFSRRPESRQSNSQPTLSKRRSSLMLLGRRGSSFFGLSVDEEPEQNINQQQEAETRDVRQTQEYARDSYESDETEQPPPPPRKLTPPPSLPAISTLRGNRGLREGDGAFMNGDDMFRNIN